MELHETKKLLHCKGNSYQAEDTPEWKKICASYSSDERLIARTHRELKKLSLQRLSNPLNKWANELNRKLSKEVQLANKYMKKCSI
jgi:hypothetical protein